MIITHIEEKAERVLEETDCFSAPVNVFECAAKLRVHLAEVSIEDEVSGLLVVKGETTHIRFNSGHHENRQRFTIAHELGHFILHSKSSPLFIDKEVKIMFRDNSLTGDIQKEREANAFAAALLMPRDLILQYISGYDLELGEEGLVRNLSKTFKVSEKAMTIRLTNLGFIDYGHF